MHTDRRRSNRRTLLKTAGMAGLAPAFVGLNRPAAIQQAGSAAFIAAVIAGDKTLVRELLALDVGLVQARDENRRSAFALAVLHGRDEVAALLREFGYEPDLTESALALDWERVASLAEASPAQLNQDHPIGGTPMYAAALAGAGNQIWRIYQFGGDPGVAPRGAGGFSPVRAALEYPDLATAEVTLATLLGNGAPPGGPQAGGSSALDAAALRGSTTAVEMLLRKGADAGARDVDHHTPLELAERGGQRDTAAMLRRSHEIPRDHAASRRAHDVDGKPYEPSGIEGYDLQLRLRMVGQSHGNFDAVREMVERHPLLVHSVATTNEGAVEACAHMGRLPIVEFLLERGAPYSLPTAVMRGDRDYVLAALKEQPLRIYERGAHDDFALLWYPVIGGGNLEMAELLMERGAEVEQQHYLGTTALHYAALRGQTEMVQLFIEHGADVQRIGRKFDAAGQTPLQMAGTQGHDDVVRLLQDRGATV